MFYKNGIKLNIKLSVEFIHSSSSDNFLITFIYILKNVVKKTNKNIFGSEEHDFY